MKGEQKHGVLKKKNLLNDELKMNQIKVFLLCLKKGINLMFQTNINCYFKGRHSSSNFTNVLTGLVFDGLSSFCEDRNELRMTPAYNP